MDNISRRKLRPPHFEGIGRMSQLIAVIDDEADILELVSLHLTKAGFQVEKFLDPNSFFASLRKKIPNLILLDLMLPGADGFDICKSLKRRSETQSVPIIMLTAKSDETDKVLGLELGADDYITKPFSPKELVARVKAVLRRNGGRPGEPKKISIGRLLVMDPEKHEVLVEGRRADLTSSEFNILYLLASHRGRVFTREQILDHIWGSEKIVLDRTIDVHIKNLRDGLGPAAGLIKNIRGVGYKLEE